MIRLLRGAIEWFFRRIAALLLATLLLWAALQIQRVLEAHRIYPGLEATQAALRRDVAYYAAVYPGYLDRWRSRPAAAMASRIAAIERERQALDAASPWVPLSTQGMRRSLRIRLLELERDYLQELAARTRSLEDLRSAHQQAYARLKAEFPPGETIVCRSTPRWSDFTSRQRRVVDLCRANRDAFERYQQGRRRHDGLQPATLGKPLEAVLEPLREELGRQRRLTESWIGRQAPELRHAFGLALTGLIAILLLPLALRAVFYFLIAPAAARCRPVCLLPQSSGELGEAGGGSSVSIELRVAADEELLVHSDYLQSRPQQARLDTQWLLASRYPLSSLASGLFALTRIRTASAHTCVLSATGADALTELAAIPIPAGSALVLQPRSLVGVLQQRGRPIGIASHWRLTSLSAWLTLQLRYLVFRGPATVIVRGCRGVRVEPVTHGRQVHQPATIGFSANAYYAVARAEPFLPYLLGRRALLDDRFSGSSGYYLYEETTVRDRSSSVLGRQFNALSDAILKVFGI
ncbi:MAG: hypothetical protein IT480_08380 [Gammaproteobacteria bacterium]|nr:hypothetical protein [Gammaproteobacteria bacterium]